MAQLEVQPRKSKWLIWLIAIVIVVLFIFYLLNERSPEVTAEAASDSSTIESSINSNWSGVEPNLPDENFGELRDTNLSVRGNDRYTVYGIAVQVIFDPGKSSIRAGAEEKLEQIAASAEKRFPQGAIRIYASPDTSGNAADAAQLAADRGTAIRKWILKNSKIKEGQITVNPAAASPAAADGTAGKQQNRKIEIVIRSGKS